MKPATPPAEKLTMSEGGARVIPVPPPLFYALAFGTGMALRSATVPLAIDGSLTRILPGVILGGAGILLVTTAVARIRRRGTTLVPHRPVTRLLTDGPYRLSRNPMYTGLALTYVGATLLVGTWWPLLTLPAAGIAIWILFVAPEERYLATRFGQDYTTYTQKTRRWL